MAKAASFDDWFALLPPEIAPVALALRQAVDMEGGNLSAGLAWGFPCWSGHERVCSIVAHAAHCNLQLWAGARLAPRWPHRIKGTGKQLRHVSVAAPDAVDDEVRDIICAAIELDHSAPVRVR